MSGQEFLAMGGYAAYVWPAYGLALVVLIANAVLPHRRERQLLRAADTAAGRTKP